MRSREQTGKNENVAGCMAGIMTSSVEKPAIVLVRSSEDGSRVTGRCSRKSLVKQQAVNREIQKDERFQFNTVWVNDDEKRCI